MTTPVITVKMTIMDGTVVRWFRTLDDARHQRAVLSASRRGVKVGHEEYLTDIDTDWIEDATRAYEKLRRAPAADMSGWATHVHRGPSNGPLVPVEEARSDG